MRKNHPVMRPSALCLVALSTLGVLALTAAGCGGDESASDAAVDTAPAQTVTSTPATEPFPDPTSASEIALAFLETDNTPEGRRPAVKVVGLMLSEMLDLGACGNTREELAQYTLDAVNSLGAVGVNVRPVDLLVEVSTETAVSGTGGDCEGFFTAYVNQHR